MALKTKSAWTEIEEGDVTLLCHCAEREKHCHRHLLQALILSSKV